MKKTLLLIASAALLLVGCKQENLGLEAGDGEMVSMTVTASVQGEELSKAAIDQDGKGAHADRCIMVLYYGDKVYGRYVAAVSGYHATFDVTVPAKRTYNAVFWADCAAEDGGDLYYNTADLKNITLKSAYVGNNDKRDAFFKCKEYTVENKSQSFTAELTRPFSQINVISTDIQALKLAELYPQKVNLSFSAATSFNAMSGECGDAEAITYETDVYKAYDPAKEQLTLSMDYLFASTEQGAVDIDFKAPTEGELKVEYSFTNIPYMRNYRTNIIGNLLTADAHWDVTINPEWNEPDEDVAIVDAGSVAAANEAFANGATRVRITSVGEETTLYLPQTSEDVTIEFANPDEGVTVKYGPAPTKAAGEKPAVVNIATNDVTKFTVSGINNTVWLVNNQAALANALANATNKQVVALSNDITMSGEWTPVTSKNNGEGHYYGTFDGKNHVISNLKITDYTGTYAGFFSTISGATIKNVTFKNANVTNAVSNEGARGAVIVGWSYAGVIDNCHVINSSVTGGQKVAGIVGCISVEGAASKNEVTNCSVEGLTLSSNIPDDILYQAGALVGYMQLVAANPNGILIENNTVKDITINDAYSGPVNTAWYCGTFIGSIIRQQKVDGQKIILNNNTISGNNTELYKSMYSSEYFGWATNTENYTGAIAPIVIDGQEWTPNYPVVNVTKGKKYLTIAKAVEEVSAGDEIKITAAGTYTVPGISKNITITGDAEGNVVFDCTGSGSIASISNGATFKNVTMNFGQSSYHGFQHAGHIVMEGCTLNGLFFSYGDMTFTECIFNQENEEYNMWCYGNDVTYDGCTFNSKGKFLNVYCESNATAYNIVAKDCIFNTSKKNKPALNIKETSGSNFLKYNVTITNCSCNDLQNTVDMTSTSSKFVGGPIWQVDDRKSGASAITVTVDGKLVYKNGVGLAIANASQLKAFADYVNSASASVKGTFTLDADIDLTGIDWVSVGQTGHGQFGGTFDGQGHTISNLSITNSDDSGDCATGLFGWLAYATVKNVNVNTAIVSGHHNVGVIAGYLEGSTIDNCTVTGATVSCTHASDDADGDKCGGIVGYAGNAGTPVKDCTVSNTTISAGRDAGQVAGAAKEANLTGCTATGVTVTANGTSTGANIRNEIIGRIL